MLNVLSGSSATNQNSVLGAANSSNGATGPWFGGYDQNGAYVATAYASSALNILTKTYAGSTITGYVNGKNAITDSVTYNLTTANIVLGAQITNGTYQYLSGYLSESTIFLSVISTTDRQTLEHSQENFYSIAGQ